VTPGVIIFVVLALALYAVTIFSAGYRRRWWMAGIVVLVLGIPMGLSLGGEGVTGWIGVAVLLGAGWAAWWLGRRQGERRRPPRRPPARDLF
jgi:hypothetical protein